MALNSRREVFVFPYSETTPVPSSDDRIEEIFVDPELGREGFSYRPASGAEGGVHLDSVLEYNEDPSYIAELTLYRLTLEAKQRFESSGLSGTTRAGNRRTRRLPLSRPSGRKWRRPPRRSSFG